MCGVAGIVRLDGQKIAGRSDHRALRAMSRAIDHRGPDDETYLIREQVGLAFRRLSIMDPAGGGQPLFSEDRSIAVICNGEIFNHRDLRTAQLPDTVFKTHSDCEVIAHLYRRKGIASLGQLNGIFAGAILDQRQQKLFLFRDRLGVKPLFYHVTNTLLVFGSECKAVLTHPAVPRQFNWSEALVFRDRMHVSHMSEPLPTFFEGLRQLPGGCYLEVDLQSGACDEHRYWDPAAEAAEREPIRDVAQAIDAYRETLFDAVRLQMMSDVGCGLFLSGGIDSLAVARLAAESSPLETFTVLSQSTLTNGDAASAHAAAQALNLSNHLVYFDWREIDVTPDLWRSILWKVEMPIAGAEQLYKYLLHGFARETVPGIKVMLLGSGSDEFNGGYSKAVFNDSSAPSWDAFERTIGNYERHGMLLCSGTWCSYAQAATVRPLIRTEFLGRLAEEAPFANKWHAYRETNRRTLQSYQLWHEDRTAAANAIEARVPFLDHRLVELTYGVAPELYRELFWDKHILRAAMRPLLPEAFCQREKGPFFIGEDLRYTRRLLYNLLQVQGGLLLESAATTLEEEGVADPEILGDIFRRLPEDPEYGRVDMVLDLVNMGLLASIAREPSAAPDWSGTLPVSSIQIDDWQVWQEAHATSLIQRTPGLELQTVLRFADGIRIVRRIAGDKNAVDDGDLYVLRNETLEFCLEPELEPWAGFLRGIDGKRTVAEILEDRQIGKFDIWKHLEEAIEYEILSVDS